VQRVYRVYLSFKVVELSSEVMTKGRRITSSSVSNSTNLFEPPKLLLGGREVAEWEWQNACGQTERLTYELPVWKDVL